MRSKSDGKKDGSARQSTDKEPVYFTADTLQIGLRTQEFLNELKKKLALEMKRNNVKVRRRGQVVVSGDLGSPESIVFASAK